MTAARRASEDHEPDPAAESSAASTHEFGCQSVREHRNPLVIVGCGARKAPRPSPAADLYTGTYTRKRLRAAATLTDPARIRIISALHGLVLPTTVLEPYDLRLGQLGAITPDQLREQARTAELLDEHTVIVLAGRKYTDLTRRVWPHATAPLAGTRGIGDQLRILTRLEAGR